MKNFHCSKLLFFLAAFIFFFHWSCKDDDDGGTPLPPVTVAAGTASGITLADVGDANNGTDLQITFNPAADENKIGSYRIMVIKSGQAGTFNLSKAEALAADNYFPINKTGAQTVTVLAENSNDIDGDLIANDIPYKVFVMSVSDGVNATKNALSSASAEIVLATEQMDVSADAAFNLLAEDIADNGNGSDLMLSFEKAADENKISAYRIFVVENSMSDLFMLDEANQNINYYEALPENMDIATALPADATDIQGNLISNNIAYVLFVLSVADGQNANLNALSAPSNEIILTDTSPSVEVTYICNDGIMISNDEHTVLIDAVNTWGNLDGWARPGQSELQAVENGDGIYADIDVIMVTHNHGDHYDISAISNYLTNHPNTKLIAPPQVLNYFSTFQNQIVDLTVQQFNKEKTTVNGVEIDVLYIKHFNQFGNNFCDVQNYGYVVHMDGKKFMHLGDVDLSNSNLDQLDLLGEEIDVAFIPTFGDLVTNANKTVLFDNANPKNIVALHFLLSQINTSMSQVNNIYPGAFIFEEPFEFLVF